MTLIERIFARAKHWQIFLLFAAVLVIGEFPVIGNFTAAVNPQESYAGVFLVHAPRMAPIKHNPTNE